MSDKDYKKVTIGICENGFVVHIPNSNESFIFTSSKKLQKWLEDNITETGQVKDFCNGLDNGSDKSKYQEQLNIGYADTITNTAVKALRNSIDKEILNGIIGK